MDWTALFTSFTGRITRKPFWIGVLVLTAIQVSAQLMADQFDGDRFAAAVDLLLAYPEFAVFAKRGHDRNISTWVVGAFFVLTVMTDLFELAGMGLNRTTQPVLFYLVAVAIGLFALVLLVDLGFRRGTRGENRYGPDPLNARP